MARPDPGRTRVLAWSLAVLANVLGGCCPQPELMPPVRSPAPEAASPPVLEPSPMLQLLRDERLASLAPIEHAPRRARARARPSDAPEPKATSLADPPVESLADADEPPASEAAEAKTEETADSSVDSDASPDAEAETDPDVRQVVVPRRSPFGTPENLVRARMRSAEDRRPRFIYLDRFLVRTSGPICDCEGSRRARDEARAFVEALVVRARPALKACLAQDLVRDPRVLVDAPTLLVVSQAIREEPVVYRFVPTLQLGPDGVEVRALGWPGEEPDDELAACLVAALEGSGVERSPLPREHRVQVPIVAFSQQRFAVSWSPFNSALAFEAAALGWQHYERGEYEAALELFRDAHWVFQLEEYRYLEGLALEQLGYLDAAAAAFAEYLVARPYAPEAATLQGRIDRLRARARAPQ